MKAYILLWHTISSHRFNSILFEVGHLLEFFDNRMLILTKCSATTPANDVKIMLCFYYCAQFLFALARNSCNPTVLHSMPLPTLLLLLLCTYVCVWFYSFFCLKATLKLISLAFVFDIFLHSFRRIGYS